MNILDRAEHIYRTSVRKGAPTSVLMRLFIEFVASLILTVVFLKSWYVGGIIGGVMGRMFHYLITAAIAGALAFAIYPFSGGYINTNHVIFGLLSWSNHKLGKTRADRIASSVAYLIAHILGAFLGAMLASVLPWLPTPSFPTWPTGPFTPVSSFFSELLAVFAYTMITGLVTDFCWASEETVCLRVFTDGETGQQSEKPRRYQSMNSYFGTAIFLARFALGAIFVTTSSGVLNVDIAFWANAWASIWTLSGFPIINGVFFLLAHLLGAAFSGLVYYLFRKVATEHMLSKKQAGFQ